MGRRSPTWVPPTKLYNVDLGPEQYPDGKLFNTITHGIRKMPGYGAQIKAEDRWAVVAYLRALQTSRNADALAELIPENRRPDLKTMQEAVKQRLDEEAKKAAEAASKSAEDAPKPALKNS